MSTLIHPVAPKSKTLSDKQFNSLDTWEDLVPLDATNLPRLDLAHLPDWAGEFAEAISEATETPPELAAAMVLVTCATATARSLQVLVKPGYIEPCNLWVVAALPPGNRKSAVQTAATKPLISWERIQATELESEILRVTSEQKTLESRAKEMRSQAARCSNNLKARDLLAKIAELEKEIPEIPIQPQIWTSDATPERLGSLLADQKECMAWLSSEGGVFDMLAGRYSNGIPNLDLILKAHSGDSERVDRGSRPPIFLHQPRLSIGLSPQPDVLHGLASKQGFRGRGLLGRFLYLLPPSPLGYRKLNTTAVPKIINERYEAGLCAILNWNPDINEDGREQPHQLKMSPDALSLWSEYAHAIEKLMRPNGDLENFTDWAGKAPGAAARIAGTLHAIQHAHGKPWKEAISGDTMTDALEIMAVVMRHSLAALDMMGADPTIGAARQVWNWIERQRLPHFTQREAFNALRSTFPRVKFLKEALDALSERGYIRVIEPNAEKGKAGRPRSPRIQVRPDLQAAWK